MPPYRILPGGIKLRALFLLALCVALDLVTGAGVGRQGPRGGSRHGPLFGKRTRKPPSTTADPGPTTTPVPTIAPQTLRTQKEIEAAMIKSEIIPDLFHQAPKNLQPILVKFEGNSTADLGNSLSIRDLEYWAPLVQWKANESSYYTLLMLNLDMPTRKNPTQREWIVWLMVNIPGCWVMRGDQIYEYEEPDPEKGAGSHRYVALVYYQKKGKQKFREYSFNLLPSMLPQECRRQKFLSRFFALDYKLGDPIGINFWETQYEKEEDSVPTMNYEYYQDMIGSKEFDAEEEIDKFLSRSKAKKKGKQGEEDDEEDEEKEEKKKGKKK